MSTSKRLGRPDGIANVVNLLTSYGSSYVNGGDLMVTGGLHCT